MILINALSAHRGGGQVYLQHLLDEIPEAMTDKVIILAHKKNVHLFHKYSIKIIVSKFASKSIYHRSIFEKFFLKQFLLKENVTVYFSVASILPSWKHEKIKFVCVFQNQLPFQPAERKRYPFGWLRMKFLRLKYVQLHALKKSDICIFLTETSKNIIEEQAQQKSKCSVIIPHGIDPKFKKSANYSHPNDLPSEYVLYISILDFYKAQLEVIIAWERLRSLRTTNEKLVLIGPENPKYGKKVRALIKKLKLENEVILKGNISHEELPTVYNHAKVNLFASSCETFPIILLEQMASDTPILCSNYIPFEIAENSVEYFDPYKPAQLTDLLLKYLDNPEARAKLSRKTLHYAQKYDWSNTAVKTWDTLSLKSIF
jgi:glycosyltransferase involved in cell wall biosynthesis